MRVPGKKDQRAILPAQEANDATEGRKLIDNAMRSRSKVTKRRRFSRQTGVETHEEIEEHEAQKDSQIYAQTATVASEQEQPLQ